MGTTTRTPSSEIVDGLSKGTLVYDAFAPSRTFCFQRVPAFVEIRDVLIVKCDMQPCIGDRKRVTWRTTETWTRHRFMPFQQRWDLEIRAEYVNDHPPGTEIRRTIGAIFDSPVYCACQVWAYLVDVPECRWASTQDVNVVARGELSHLVQ